MILPTGLRRRPLLVGNWKMHGLRAACVARAQAVARGAVGLDCDLMLCPPATALTAVHETLDASASAVALGGQACHAERNGAFTGDVSAAMLRDAGCVAVLAGHSERRAAHGEDDVVIRHQAASIQAAGMTVILCVGETAAQHAAGATLVALTAQTTACLPPQATAANTVIAYEPVWAIGAGCAATPAAAQAAHVCIRDCLRAHLGPETAAQIRILYGGSLSAASAADLLRLPDVDGGLVGGASLDPDGFLAIARLAAG